MADLIEPRTLKGFRDYPPALMIPRERLLQTAREVYRSYGFAPIDTPALEYAEVLLGKGGGENDRLVYRFTDHGDRDVALRFDLTVPFARFAAQHVGQLGTPFKRYAMGPVWRGENTAHGRYREFWQCDFDTIGTTSNAADCEIALVINDLFTALGFEGFEIRVNNRLVLNGVLEGIGLADKTVPVLRALDKLAKAGREKVAEEMAREAGATAAQADRVLDLAAQGGTNAELLDAAERAAGGNERAVEGVRRLRELLTVAETAGVPAGRVRIDLSIARGLDYYTGTIYETFLTDFPGIGSVCSGGRYDNLASKFTKQVLPGVGASLGVDRLLAAMEELKHPWLTGQTTPAEVLVVQFDAARLGDYQRVARLLRTAGIATEVYPEAKKPGPQLAFAEKRGFRLALIAGGTEFAAGVWKVKNLATRTEVVVPEPALVTQITGLAVRPPEVEPTRLDLLPDSIRRRYTVHEWKHACAILSTDFSAELKDLIELLEQFELKKSQVIAAGGAKSSIASSLDSFLYARGWKEKKFDTSIIVDGEVVDAPTHDVDCFKNKIAIEVEWNNKDTFYDRDLNNFRLLFELRAISVGVIITRSDELDEIFKPLARAGVISKDKFVDSTTHLGKLLPKINGGGAGGCPLLVFGIGKAAYVEDC